MSQTKNISLLLLAAGMATAGGLGLDELSRETTNHNAIEGVQIMGGASHRHLAVKYPGCVGLGLRLQRACEP